MAQPEPVRLVPGGAVDRPAEQALLAAAAACGGDVDAMVELLRAASGAASGEAAAPLDLPLTGAGRTREQWELLASVAAQDLSAARVLEPHLDALSILSQAGVPAPAGLLGVYASESGGRTPALRPVPDGPDTAWLLDGEKPWCSLADRCAAAVVTGREADGTRRAVLVDLSHPGVAETDSAWPALGRVDRLLHAMAALLARAADDVDAGRLDHGRGMVEADRIRGTVAQLCTEVMDVVGQATGPGPLTGSAAHARAVADLQVYLRQHHGHRDDARLGAALLTGETDGGWTW
ncbi:hypothetical protein [Micrococcus luteus]|uniref:hypothetical protein n=1 Tax=Micrococcus luteus TaxID=1270 RepID=UPI0001C3959E|nr:hypothetical protein [Micrococcus luteus]